MGQSAGACLGDPPPCPPSSWPRKILENCKYVLYQIYLGSLLHLGLRVDFVFAHLETETGLVAGLLGHGAECQPVLPLLL